MDTKLKLSSAYHLQTDGKTKRTTQSLEDLLRVCVLEQGGAWDIYLSLIEFTYNNNFHSNIGMTPFKALYGRRCRTPLCWYESGDSAVYGPGIVQQTFETPPTRIEDREMKQLGGKEISLVKVVWEGSTYFDLIPCTHAHPYLGVPSITSLISVDPQMLN